ncbi:Serine/threonine-protein kinase MRCK beta [Cichlidogyrus casuarinus]|uniref:non-specific serine/threonine protein kinase n=1 Tax=Cichlidogyrus casuarinus TaxID=1844966 RepID=A0ABD2QAR1_9PLAT
MKSLKDRGEELCSKFITEAPFIEEGTVNLEYLLDTFLCLYYECKLPQHRNERNCSKFINSAKKSVANIENCRLSRIEFDTVRVVGSGAYGEVSAVRWKHDKNIYALKSLHKYDMLKRSDRTCFQEERDVLVKAMLSKSPWISRLHYTFQDEKFLYFVMDFYNGGDMLTMLTKFGDSVPEEITKFYVAEMILAIDSLHKLGYVHRDIKPDNVLLDSSGHIVLADFGSCLRIEKDGLVRNNTPVGTPDYISPEILRASESGQGTFGIECDYWSLGVVMYELLFGETPFYSENLVETYKMIMNFSLYYKVPGECSEEATNLMSNLICDRVNRLGKNGISDFMSHPFFKGIDWDNIRNRRFLLSAYFTSFITEKAPYIPEVTSPEDTSNFDIEESTRNYEGPPLGNAFKGCQVACIGFTYTKGQPFYENNFLVRTSQLESLSENGDLKEKVSELEHMLSKLQTENSIPSSPGPEIKKLLDKVNLLEIDRSSKEEQLTFLENE